MTAAEARYDDNPELDRLMGNPHDYVRVDDGWALGHAGKGLLIYDNGQARLFLWRTWANDRPHHPAAQQQLGLAPDQVAAHLLIDKSGRVEVWPRPSSAQTQELTAEVLALDSRLTLAPDEWDFGVRPDA